MQQLALSAVPNSRQPSKKLEKLINNCVSEFSKLNRSVNLALEQGRKEGFTDLEIGKLIRHKLITAGFSDRTARRYLPSSAKGKQGGASTQIVLKKKTDNLSVNSAINSVTSSINRTLAAKSKGKSSNNNKNDFQFTATVSHMGPRFVISIPTKHNSDITKFVGKELDVIVSVREGVG